MTFNDAMSVLLPHLVRQFHDHAQLRPLLLLGEHVALLGRGEAALRRQAELIERAYLVASSMRRLMSSFFSSVPLLEVTRPSTTILLPFGRKRSGSKPPARVAVVFEEIAVVVQLAEQRSATGS